jgi:hypothetical protein
MLRGCCAVESLVLLSMIFMFVTFSVLSNYKIVKCNSVNNAEYLIGVLAVLWFSFMQYKVTQTSVNLDLCLKNAFFKESSKKICLQQKY